MGDEDKKEFATLEEINAYYGGKNKPSADGSVAGYQSQQAHYQDYINALDNYGEAHGNDGDFNPTLFNLYRDYANKGYSNASSAYAQAKATEEGAINTKAQISNMREQSLKYAANAIAAQGFGSQGISESTITGISNNAQAQRIAAELARKDSQDSLFNTYMQTANDLESAKISDTAGSARNEQNDAFELASEMLNNGVSYDEVIKLYGDQMSTMQIATLDALTRDSRWLSGKTTDGQGYGTYEEMLANDVRTENTDYGISDVADEAKLLFNEYSDSEKRENGDCVRLEHEGGGSTNGVYMIYYNGKWYKTTKAQYEKATNKGWFKGGKLKKEQSSGTFAN